MMSTGLMDLKDGAMMKNEGMDGRELYLTSFAKVIILNEVTSWVLFWAMCSFFSLTSDQLVY